jgi:hypothetical protein
MRVRRLGARRQLLCGSKCLDQQMYGGQRPTTTTTTVVGGDKVYTSQTEAETAMKSVTVCQSK